MYSGVPVNYRTNSQLVFSTGCTVTLRPQQAIGGIRKASCFRHFTERHTSQKLFMFDFFFYSRFCFVLFCSTHSHFYRKICTPAYSCSHPVSQSCSSSAVQKNPQPTTKQINHADSGRELHICELVFGVLVGSRWAGLIISEIADLLGFSTYSRL